jgi:hypothetical protein
VSLFVQHRTYWARGEFAPLPKIGPRPTCQERCSCGNACRDGAPFCPDCMKRLPATLHERVMNPGTIDNALLALNEAAIWLREHPVEKGVIS